MIEFLILAATFLIAYANGANDNFKGVATLFGSSTADYRKALNWATVTTFAGSITAFFLSQKLIHSFSGKGLVPDAVIAEPAFLLAVILGAGLTVLFASKTGMPISTTHSLVGALAGAALIATGTEGGLHFWEAIGKKFAVPLLISPLMAIFFTVM
ncbi:MAG: inorganic phosphate transporter, partial [Candidatus Omnitrophica bacterium]|nr:inorganic phosphate transporter [Candidatus Omnitrophota bacterium]